MQIRRPKIIAKFTISNKIVDSIDIIVFVTEKFLSLKRH